ncbi:MAG: NUDIX domain-containing protein, partial [Candidatus Gracilibacteria bacterium]|nr:NUDIX domain-containing protein [Candidatus Gracilibacteria bacterium]
MKTNLPILEDESFGIIPLIKTINGLKILEIQHNAGHWGLPKGHPEGNESNIETARRELTEETGINNIDIIDGVSFSQKY